MARNNNIPPTERDPRESTQRWITELSNPDTRNDAMFELSKMRGVIPDLGVLLWYSFGTIAILVQEITNCYSKIDPTTFTDSQSNIMCNVNDLLQSVAMHPRTKTPFLRAKIPVYLYPFLLTTTQTSAFERVRFTSLRVITALLEKDDPGVIHFLLMTDFLPHCYKSIESGSEMTKALGVYILDSIINEDFGFKIICRMSLRLTPFIITLNNLITSLAGYPRPCTLILKHAVRCYVRLARNRSAREALRRDLPVQLKDGTFFAWLQGDWDTKTWLYQLFELLATPED